MRFPQLTLRLQNGDQLLIVSKGEYMVSRKVSPASDELPFLNALNFAGIEGQAGLMLERGMRGYDMLEPFIAVCNFIKGNAVANLEMPTGNAP